MTIVASNHERLSIRTHRKQSESISEPPASWTLAHVSADGGHIANLRTGCISGSLRQHGVMLFHLRVLGDFEQCHEGTDAQPSQWNEPHASQFLDILHVQQSLRTDDAVRVQS